jgi:hypothetical protein
LEVDSSRARHRIDRSARSVDARRTRIKVWLAERQSGQDFARFSNHFHVLNRVLSAMLDAITGALAEVKHENCHSGLVYEQCAKLDESLAIATRLFDWYSAKYDQRLSDEYGPVLRAADEVVRSCWSEPFSWTGKQPPTGPLAYLDDRFDAYATTRRSVPSDLRAPRDAVVAEFISELPIPTIALPDYAVREAWWLALVAHETGHHVQKDVADEQATRERIAAALAETGKPELAAQWAGWGLEVFADAYSAAMIGDAAGWVVDELQHSAPAKMFALAQAGSRYPPPVVRLALFESFLAELGLSARPPVGPPVAESDLMPAVRKAIEADLAAAPAVARALATLPVGAPHLRDLASVEPDLLAQPGQLRGWADQLARPGPALPALTDRASARLVIAAGVAAYRQWAAQPAAASVLPTIHDNLLTLLPRCGPPGYLAAAPAMTEVTALAERLSRRLISDALAGSARAEADQ